METLGNLTNNVSGLWQSVLDFSTKYGLRLLGAIVVLVLGLWVIKS